MDYFAGSLTSKNRFHLILLYPSVSAANYLFSIINHSFFAADTRR